MKVVSFKKWNSNPQNTYNFKLVTKLTDFGSPDGWKTILGFYLNINKNSHYTAESPVNLFLTFSYRTSTGENWKDVSSITKVNPRGTTLIEELFDNPIKNKTYTIKN